MKFGHFSLPVDYARLISAKELPKQGARRSLISQEIAYSGNRSYSILSMHAVTIDTCQCFHTLDALGLDFLASKRILRLPPPPFPVLEADDCVRLENF